MLRTILILLTLPGFFVANAQNTRYTQLANELQFNRTISEKLAGEVWLGGAFSNTPSDNRVLSTNIQRYFFIWMNYQYSPRWKLSSSLAYYYNRNVPDIGQYLSPEYKLTLQSVYFIHKTGYILSTKIRVEFRYIMNAEGIFEDKYRYRHLIKFVKPLNSKVLRKGIVYFLSSEELLLAPKAKTKGINFFDRNRFDIGFGYMITNDLQVELAYLNEYIPRDDGDIINNTVEFTLIFNNLFPKIKERIFSGSSADRSSD